MKTLCIIIVITVALALPSCIFQRINRQDVIGKYRADLPEGGTETLELFPDGKCEQEIHFPYGTTYKVLGTWRFSSETKYLQIQGIRQSLTREGKLNPNLATAPNEEVLATPVSRSLSGDMAIMLYEGIDYRKVK